MSNNSLVKLLDGFSVYGEPKRSKAYKKVWNHITYYSDRDNKYITLTYARDEEMPETLSTLVYRRLWDPEDSNSKFNPSHLTAYCNKIERDKGYASQYSV